MVALPPGGYDGTTCISDFRSVILPAADPPMNSFPAAAAAAAGHSFGGMQSQPRNLFADGLGLLNSPNVADTVLQAYSAADSLNRQQLHMLLAHLGAAVRAHGGVARFDGPHHGAAGSHRRFHHMSIGNARGVLNERTP